MNAPDGSDQALLYLLKALREREYSFITPTPATHARVVTRRDEAHDLRDVFGWSLPFHEDAVGAEILSLMREASVLQRRGDRWCSAVRVSSLETLLFLHSAYPTLAPDSVFFGPDSYRFADFIIAARQRHQLPTPTRIADIGAGAGVGGVVAGRDAPGAEIVLTDINASALRLARVNATFSGVSVSCVQTDALGGAEGAFDSIVANPPYIIDAQKRAYRDGGALYGGQVALDWTKAALPRLANGGAFLLYTGAAIVNGAAPLLDELRRAASGAACAIEEARELDPDVFGEELERDAYRDVERIAVIGVTFRRA